MLFWSSLSWKTSTQQCRIIILFIFLFSYLSSMRTQRSLKCLFRCFFCLFLLFFFSIFLCAFSSRSKLSGGRIMWGKRSSSWGLPSASALRGSSWRKGSSRGDSPWWSSNAAEADMKDDLLPDKHEGYEDFLKEGNEKSDVCIIWWNHSFSGLAFT